MAQLIDLQTCPEIEKVKELRKLYDYQIRNKKSRNVRFRPERIRSDVIAYIDDDNSWGNPVIHFKNLREKSKVGQNMKTFLVELLLVEARNKRNRRENQRREENQNSKPMCIFCRRKSRSRDCDITKPENCFICMNRAQKCSDKMKFFNCKGRHNAAVCTYKSESSRNHSSPDSVLRWHHCFKTYLCVLVRSIISSLMTSKNLSST